MSGPAPRVSLGSLGWIFLRLGCTSFGGPVAHLGYLHEECVRRRRWLDEAEFADLVALCQFLPGPASSQLVFALGKRQGGLAGALLASLGFTLPSALLMILCAYGVNWLGSHDAVRWLHGLKVAAVAVVAQAVWSMGRKLCPDLARLGLAVLAAAVALLLPGVTGQVLVIVAGGAFGWLVYRGATGGAAPGLPGGAQGRQGRAAVACLVLWAALLLILPLAASASGSPALGVFDRFYRAGSLVFGGGHVILPLLRAELVPTGLVADEVFLAGYGAVQAVPGPLFTLAAYLGTVAQGGFWAWTGGLLCLLAVFLPAWLLVGGALPFWEQLKGRPWARACLQGSNAAVVGILFAALCVPVCSEGLLSWADGVWAVAAFVALEWRRWPVWAVVPALALLLGLLPGLLG